MEFNDVQVFIGGIGVEAPGGVCRQYTPFVKSAVVRRW